MRHTSISVTGPATVAQAWQRYTSYEQWPRWAPHISSVKATTSHLDVGAHGRVYSYGRVLWVNFTITDVDDRAHSWSWHVHRGLLHFDLTHTLNPEATGTRAGLQIRGPALITQAYKPLAYAALRRLVSAASTQDN